MPMLKSINITNLGVNEFSGGWSGMNHHIYLQLKKQFTINLIENINPAYSLTDKYISKICRAIGVKGKFAAFTAKRLSRIKNETETKLDKEAVLNFYHGATPWLHVTNELPYALYLDACFATYIKVYHNQADFSNSQLNALFKKETDFLNKAQAVFFSSAWAMDDAKKAYGLTGSNFFVAGLGGGFDLPYAGYKNDTPYFLFMATDFFGKGGDKVVNTFLAFSKSNPGYKLVIAGQQPPGEFLKHDGVEYAGFLNKANPAEYQQLVALFSNAYCFLLPTSRDMTPLVLLEAGSAGCPVISTNVYGISEIVKHKETGLLIDAGPRLEKDLINSILQLCNDKGVRNKMGAAAWQHVNSNFGWDKVGDFIVNKLSPSQTN
jgi:glycosyltransferase involved in cell wall biosynthesis